jgi:hypothetical protein
MREQLIWESTRLTNRLISCLKANPTLPVAVDFLKNYPTLEADAF